MVNSPWLGFGKMRREGAPSWGSSVPTQMVTATVWLAAGEAPQAFEADTVMSPPVLPAVAVMEFVVEVPDHPPGSVQV
jgi:hypothetical protein